MSRDIEGPKGTDLLSTCRELGIALVIACPLSRGVLTSTFSRGDAVSDDKDMRPKMMPRFLEANREHNVKVVRQYKALADKKGCSTSQLSLAWLLKQGNDIFPIPGTKQMKYLEDNWGALEVELTDEEEAEIRAFAEASALAGGQVPPPFEGYIYRDTKEEGS